jgi:hypothetical protein
LQPDGEHRRDGGSNTETRELDGPRTGHVGHHNEDRPENQRRAEVGLHEDQETRDGEDAQRLEEDPVLPDGFLCEIAGEDDDHEQLGELRGLYLHGSYGDPARGATRIHPHQGYGEQQC